jgi:hypothetical protein
MKEENSSKRFDVALSFPGEHRDFVRRVADDLSQQLHRERIFYDEWYEAKLARPNLDVYLQSIYRNQAELIVVFLCAEYEKKEWSNSPVLSSVGLTWLASRNHRFILLEEERSQLKVSNLAGGIVTRCQILKGLPFIVGDRLQIGAILLHWLRFYSSDIGIVEITNLIHLSAHNVLTQWYSLYSISRFFKGFSHCSGFRQFSILQCPCNWAGEESKPSIHLPIVNAEMLLPNQDFILQRFYAALSQQKYRNRILTLAFQILKPSGRFLNCNPLSPKDHFIRLHRLG